MDQIRLVQYPCAQCGGTDYRLTESGPHLRADCAECGKSLKFLSRKIAEQPVRSLAERPDISVSLRARVFERYQYRCVICGKNPQDGVRLVVAHLIDREKAIKEDLYDPIIDSELNLTCTCEACNSGMRFSRPSMALMLRCLKIWEASRD